MTERVAYYQDYWKEPQFEDCTYTNWKAALTREHPSVLSAASVLDVGSGGGAILRAIARPHVRLVGVEISPGAAGAVSAAGFEGVVVDLEHGSLPFASDSFDVVLCYDVFEHLFSPQPVLSEIHRVMKPDGRALLCVPNCLNGFNRLMFLGGKHLDIMDTSHRERDEIFSNHIRLFSKKLFEEFLGTRPFEVVERHFYFPPEFTDPRYRLPQQLNGLVRRARLPELWPSLFALAFLYVCKKAHTPA
jgi:SAM-dependent methyltransferase